METLYYPPLDSGRRQVRLVRFNIDPETLSPRAHMAIFTLGHNVDGPPTGTVFEPSQLPPYYALSYTWHPMQPLQSLQVNQTTLQVGDALWQAITTLAGKADLHNGLPSQGMWWWVDQICINQDPNSTEKGGQIPLMGDIYEQCSHVVVWLGPESNNSAIAMGLFNAVGQLDGSKISPGLRELVSRTPSADWLALQDFFQERAWFTRAWTFQEYILPSRDNCTMFCGVHSVLRATFEHALKSLDSRLIPAVPYRSWARTKAWNMAWVRRKVHRAANEHGCARFPLGSLLIYAGGSQAHYPADIVFSLLGMASDYKELGIDPDPFDETGLFVYSQIVRGYAQWKGSLDLIAFAEDSKPHDDWPSWVPYWPHTTPITHNRMARQNFLSFKRPVNGIPGGLSLPYNACGGFQHVSPRKTLYAAKIECDGLCVGVVDGLGPLWTPAIDDTDRTYVLQSTSMTNRAQNLTDYESGHAIRESLWRTLKLDRSDHHLDQPAQAYDAQDLDAVRDALPTNSGQLLDGTWQWLIAHRVLLVRGHTIQQLLESHTEDGTTRLHQRGKSGDSTSRFQNHMLETWQLMRKRLFVTDRGDLGCGPAGTRRSDEIWALKGGSVLFMLRPAADGQRSVVGEVYLDRYMHGEAFNGPDGCQKVMLR